MKKILLIDILIMSLLLSSCISTGITPENTNDTFENTSIVTENTNENTIKTQEDPNIDLEYEPVYYVFDYVKDFDTYVKTGSLDPADYKGKLSQDVLETDPINEESHAERIKHLDYRPLYEFFEFDEDLFEYVCVDFYYMIGYPNIVYRYILDEVYVMVFPLCKSKEVNNDFDTLDYYNKYFSKHSPHIVVDEGDLHEYSSDVDVYKGLVIRKTEDSEVIYRYLNGIPKEVFITTEESFIHLNLGYLSGLMKDDKIFKDPKYASFVPLFSEDDSVFEAAVNKLKAPKSA